MRASIELSGVGTVRSGYALGAAYAKKYKGNAVDQVFSARAHCERSGIHERQLSVRAALGLSEM